eukprot:COSAG01_NODE_66698_length_269_cov_0.764706_1_plen_28_part_01
MGSSLDKGEAVIGGSGSPMSPLGVLLAV